METEIPESPWEHHWTLNSHRALIVNIASVLLCPFGLFLFVRLAQVMRPMYSFTFVLPKVAVYAVLDLLAIAVVSPLALMFLILLFHEWCHGLAYRWVGVKPQYGAKIVKRILPILYTTAAGAWLTKRQYLFVALTPTVLVNLVGIALMWLPSILRYLLILPLVANLCGCVGDWWMASFIIRLPASTMFEDTGEGFRYRYQTPGPTE